MPNTHSEQIRECLAHVDDCARKAAAQTDSALKQDFLDVGCRWLALAKSYHSTEHLPGFADLLGRTRWLIDDGRLSQATVRNEKLNSSRAEIADSRRLLVAVNRPAVIARGEPTYIDSGRTALSPIELPSLGQTEQTSATLTVDVFQKEGRFGWTVHGA